MSQPGTQSTSTSSDEVVEKSVRGAATTTLAGLVGRAAGLVTTLLVTHFVHKTEYGQANLALIIATVVNVLTLLAPQQALLTRRTLFAESSQIIQRFVVGSGVLVFGLLFGLGRPLLGLLHESGTLPLLQVYCAALFFERLALIPAVRLRYELRFSHLVQVDLLGDTVYVIVTMATAAYGAGAICLPLGALLRQVARVLWLKFGLRMSLLWSDVQLPNAQTQTLRSELWQMMWPIYLASMVELSTLYMDNLFVGRVYSTGAQGIYAVGYTVMMTPCETIAMYATSALVRALGLDDRDRRQQNFLAGLRYVTLLLLPIATGAALVGPTFESALLPPRWHGIAQIMAGLSLGAVSLGF
ncbi:MAG TPA: oligosaccharide flippase family protein, partial [Pseudomonadota bacterium]|nr:oligosaccharide flippase family protein [Pseudomonadota bacterium]